MQLLAASRLGRLVAFGTELSPDASFYNPDQPRADNGQWGSGAQPASHYKDNPSDDPQKWAGKTAGLLGKAGERVSTKGGYSYEFFPAKGEPGVYGELNVFDANRNVVGNLFFGHNDRGDLEGAVEVHPNHRRKGIATEMYQLGERLSGHTFKPAPKHSADAEAFWQQKNRPFGNQPPAPASAPLPPIGNANIVPDGKDDGGHFVVRDGEKIYAPEDRNEYRKIPDGAKWLDIDSNTVGIKKPAWTPPPPPTAQKVASLDAMKSRAGAKKYKAWLADQDIAPEDADHNTFGEFLYDEYMIRVRDDGRIEFEKLSPKVKKVIGDLPVVVLHHTTDAFHERVKADGLRPAPDKKAMSNPHLNSGAGVYVTTEGGSSPAVRGYHSNATAKHGGNPRTYEIETTLDELEPDPDDQDLSVSDKQFVLPRVPPDKILNLHD